MSNQNQGDYQEVAQGNVTFWNPKEPEEVEGILREHMENVGDFNSDAVRLSPLVESDEDIIVTCNKQLSDLMSRVPVGYTVKIIFTGYKQSQKSQNKYKHYRVFKKETPPEEVGAQQSAPSPPPPPPQQKQQGGSTAQQPQSGSATPSHLEKVAEGIFKNKQGFLMNDEGMFVDQHGAKTNTPVHYDSVKDSFPSGDDDLPF